ncbi:hypothetical protein [Burkholderia metallica]|uniref:hypothetical protein n=1 Tax=Burkholderia metallica TaxID=488729 RepID=UPI001CF52DE4|nr:hypothetical protein [Burkholderia metallica]MCA8023650.1 hypothetical protein [Burkholderia metallica]
MTNETLDRMLIVTALAWQPVFPIPVDAQTTSLPRGVVDVVNGTSTTLAEVDTMLKASHQPDTVEARQAIGTI